MNFLFEFFQDHKTIVTTVSIGSLTLFVASLAILPLIIAQLPDNYFLDTKRLSGNSRKPTTAIERLLISFKNLSGIILVLAGIAMLVLPGQGLITILIGFSLTNFPGKYKLERKLIGNPAIFKSLNWIRHKTGKNNLLPPP